MSRLNGLISRRQVTTGNDGKSAWAFFVRNLCLFHLDFEFLLTLTRDVGVGLHGCKRKRKQGRRDGFWANGLVWRVGGMQDLMISARPLIATTFSGNCWITASYAASASSNFRGSRRGQSCHIFWELLDTRRTRPALLELSLRFNISAAPSKHKELRKLRTTVGVSASSSFPWVLGLRPAFATAFWIRLS